MDSNQPNTEVVIEQTFDANIELMWGVWTEPELIRQWFGSDPNGTVESVKMEPKNGGNFEISFRNSDSAPHTARGKMLEVTPLGRLVYSWEWASEPGHFTQLSVSFMKALSKTKLVLRHSNLSPTSLHGYEEGWTSTLQKIVRLFARIV